MLKNCQKFRNCFSRIVEVIKVSKLRKSYLIFLKISIKVGFLQRFLFCWQGAPLLIMLKKVVYFFISPIVTKIFTPETFFSAESFVCGEEFPEEIVIFVHTVHSDIMFLKRIYLFKIIIATQILHFIT